MPLRDLADLERRIRRLEMGADQSRHKLVVPERTVSVAPPLGAGDVPYVDLSTDQNVAGVKTFVAFPVTPSSAPDNDYQVANKKYVDDNAGGGGVTDHGALTGLGDDDHTQYFNETRGDLRYLGLTSKAADSDKLDNKDSSDFVQTTGDQSVTGVKTFVAFPVTPSSAPTTDYQVANKKYVDNQIGALGIFQSYSLQWTAVTTNPSFGNAAVSAIYTTFGTLCVLVVGITMGSTTTYGVGDWRFSLPLPAKFRPGISFFGIAHMRKSGTSNHERVVQLAPTISPTDIRIFTQMDDNTNVTALNATAPFTWGNGDNIGFQIMYEWDPEAV